MPNNKLANLKSQLLTSGLQNKDQPLFQVINQLIQFLQDLGIEVGNSSSSGGGGASSAITSLNTDVVATGPGVVPAIIQPNVVTYSKIQQVAALRLVGNPNGAPQDMIEIPLGDNLSFVAGVLTVEVTPGVPGLLHRLLSSTHFDTIPASPVLGDLIYAAEGPEILGEYYGGFILAPLVEDFSGIRAGYMPGFDGTFTPSISMGYSIPTVDFITPTASNSLLATEYIDAFILSLLVEDFIGIRQGYVLPVYVTGNNAGYGFDPAISFLAPPSPATEEIEALWTRRPIGAEGQFLSVVDGIPEWDDIPEPPDPEYPWEDIPFDAGDFGATGGVTPSWAVAAGDVIRWQQQRFPGIEGIGNNVRLNLCIFTSSVSGSAPTTLTVTTPFNFIGHDAKFISIRENGNVVTNTYFEYDEAVSSTTIELKKVGGGAFDTTANETYISFEISLVLAP